MKSGINPYGLSFVRQNDATRVSSSIKTHTDYLTFDFEKMEKNFALTRTTKQIILLQLF